MTFQLWITYILTVSVGAQQVFPPESDRFEEGLQLAAAAWGGALAELSANCRCPHMPPDACCRHPVLQVQCRQFCSSGQCPASSPSSSASSPSARDARDGPRCPHCSGRLQRRYPQRCPHCQRALRTPAFSWCSFCGNRLRPQERAVTICPHCERRLQARESSMCPCCACLCLPPAGAGNGSELVRAERSLHEPPASQDPNYPPKSPVSHSFSPPTSRLSHTDPRPLRRQKRAIITQNGFALLMETHLGPGALPFRGKRHLPGPAHDRAALDPGDVDDPCRKMFSCRNGGTCQRKAFGEVRCRCLEGWSGRFCTRRN